jgi:O-succinylbenzoate synthase
MSQAQNRPYRLPDSPPIERITLHHVAMPLVESLVTSFGGTDKDRELRPGILVELHMGGAVGWGECVAGWNPGYSYETIGTATHVLQDFFIPAALGKTNLDGLARFRGHPMARMALEAAYWTAYAQCSGVPFGQLLASERKARVLVGVSVGIYPTIDKTLEVVSRHVANGYQRIKLKIKPGWHYEPVKAVRDAFPNVLLMADANSAFSLDDAPLFKRMDTLNRLMIEQPLGHDDIYQHSKLQPQLDTPICLDESIRNVDDARLAIEIGAGRIINLKPARVGGIEQSLAVHQYCLEAGVPLWIGGMLETGVGRAVNLAIASLPGVTLPCDISATDRYYNPDITQEVFTLNREDSTLTVPSGAGIGVRIHEGNLAQATRDFEAVAKSAFFAPTA